MPRSGRSFHHLRRHQTTSNSPLSHVGMLGGALGCSHQGLIRAVEWAEGHGAAGGSGGAMVSRLESGSYWLSSTGSITIEVSPAPNVTSPKQGWSAVLCSPEGETAVMVMAAQPHVEMRAHMYPHVHSRTQTYPCFLSFFRSSDARNMQQQSPLLEGKSGMFFSKSAVGRVSKIPRRSPVWLSNLFPGLFLYFSALDIR